MMYIIIVLLLSISKAKSFPQRNYENDGNFGYDPYPESLDFQQHVNEYEQQMALKPTPESSFNTYVPLIDGKPIYIPDVEDFKFPDELNPSQPKRVKSKPALGQTFVNSPYHKHRTSHKKFSNDAGHRLNSNQRKREREHGKGHFVNRHSKPMFHKKPVVSQKNSEIPFEDTKFHHPITRTSPVTYVASENYYNIPVEESVRPLVGSSEENVEHDGFDNPVVVETFNKNEQKPKEQVKPVHPKETEHDEYDSPVVVDALTRKVKPGEKEKPVHSEHGAYETPIVVEALTNKEKPEKHVKPVNPLEPVVPWHEESIEVETFNKKGKPVKHSKPGKHGKPEKDSKPVHSEEVAPDFDMYDTSVVVEDLTHQRPENHEKHIYPIEVFVPSNDSPEVPVEMESFGINEKPVEQEEPVYSEGIVPEPNHDKSVEVEPFKNENSEHLKPAHSEETIDPNDYDTPIVVEALSKKDKPEKNSIPVKHMKPVHSAETVDPNDYDTPLVVEVLSKKDKPVKHSKPEKHANPAFPRELIPESDSHEESLETFDKKEKPFEHEKKELVYSEEIVPDHNQTPVEVETLSKKEKPKHTKPSYSEEIIVPESDEFVNPIVVDALTKEKSEKQRPALEKPVKPESTDSSIYNEYDAEETVTKKEKQTVTGQPEYDDLDSHEQKETEVPDTSDVDERVLEPLDASVEGSGSISERSNLPARSFLPVDPNIWSLMSNIQAQERQKFKKCNTPKNETGNCMPIQMCSVPSVASSIDELLNNVCVIDEVFIGICCPEFPVETVRVDWDQFEEEKNGESFSENDSPEGKECGKLSTSVNKTVAWPWMAPLRAVSTGKIFCGGALINEQYVLSAAHCTTRIPRNRIRVSLGPLNAERASKEDFSVIEIKRHAQYNSRSMLNDIALLKLSKRVPLGDFRRLICLSDDDDDYAGERAILLNSEKGFSEKTEELETLPVLSKRECQAQMGISASDSVLCTVPRKETKCNDDSGAPLVIGKDKQFKVVGVLTWNRNDCDERFPAVFTRVSKYRKWIDNHAV